MPAMNSAFFDSVQGFLNRRSVSHSVECRLKSGVTPASSSSHFSIGVTSTATVGPKLAPAPVTLWEAAPPTSTTAASSCSSDCAKAFPKKHRDAINTNLVEFRTGRAVEAVIKNRIVTPVRLAASVRLLFAHRAESCRGFSSPALNADLGQL